LWQKSAVTATFVYIKFDGASSELHVVSLFTGEINVIPHKLGRKPVTYAT